MSSTLPRRWRTAGITYRIVRTCATCAAQQADGGFFLGPRSCYIDEATAQWSHAFSGYGELQDNPDIFIDTAAQMAHYLAQVRAVI